MPRNHTRFVPCDNSLLWDNLATATHCTTKHLPQHPSANAVVRSYRDDYSDSDIFVLKSYETDVLYLMFSGSATYIYLTGFYSPTTRKHISWFLYHFGPCQYNHLKTLELDTLYELKGWSMYD